MEGKENPRPRPKWIASTLALLVLLILIAAGWFVYTRYTRVGGQLVSTAVETLDLRDQGLTRLEGVERCLALRSLDLRGNDIPVEDCLKLQKLLPDCDILFDVSVGGVSYDSFLTALHLEDLPPDWESIALLTRLEELTVERCTNPAAMVSLQESLPACRMDYSLGIGGNWYGMTSPELTLTGTAVYYEELLAQLVWFPKLKSVNVTDAVMTAEQLRSLRQTYPELSFTWGVAVGDAVVSAGADTLVYAQTGARDAGALEAVLDLLPQLKTVDFTGSAVSAEARMAFQEAHPELDAVWTVTVAGRAYPRDTEVMDLNDVAMANTAELEIALPFLPALQRVEMCDTGLSNETMDALSQAWPDIRFIWKVYFSGFSLRTDATYFCASEAGINHPYLTNQDTLVFRYLVDMQGMDLGHMYISDISFLQYMPHMTYLIIAECPIYDFSPLAYCKELKYLEAFHTALSDLRPLLECKQLRDLNICYTNVSQRNAWEVLSQLTSLERLWYCNCPLNYNQRITLQNKMPDCIFFLLDGGEPSGGVWRYHQNYYEMRDFFHMYYMAGGTNGVDENGAQIIVDDWGQEFHLENYDGGPRWWESPQYSHLHPHIIGITV